MSFNHTDILRAKKALAIGYEKDNNNNAILSAYLCIDTFTPTNRIAISMIASAIMMADPISPSIPYLIIAICALAPVVSNISTIVTNKEYEKSPQYKINNSPKLYTELEYYQNKTTISTIASTIMINPYSNAISDLAHMLYNKLAPLPDIEYNALMSSSLCYGFKFNNKCMMTNRLCECYTIKSECNKNNTLLFAAASGDNLIITNNETSSPPSDTKSSSPPSDTKSSVNNKTKPCVSSNSTQLQTSDLICWFFHKYKICRNENTTCTHVHENKPGLSVSVCPVPCKNGRGCTMPKCIYNHEKKQKNNYKATYKTIVKQNITEQDNTEQDIASENIFSVLDCDDSNGDDGIEI